MKMWAFKVKDSSQYICHVEGLGRHQAFPAVPGVGHGAKIPALYTWGPGDERVKRNLTRFKRDFREDFEYVEVELSLSE